MILKKALRGQLGQEVPAHLIPFHFLVIVVPYPYIKILFNMEGQRYYDLKNADYDVKGKKWLEVGREAAGDRPRSGGEEVGVVLADLLTKRNERVVLQSVTLCVLKLVNYESSERQNCCRRFGPCNKEVFQLELVANNFTSILNVSFHGNSHSCSCETNGRREKWAVQFPS
jgi:hypothetical protein